MPGSPLFRVPLIGLCVQRQRRLQCDIRLTPVAPFLRRHCVFAATPPRVFHHMVGFFYCLCFRRFSQLVVGSFSLVGTPFANSTSSLGARAGDVRCVVLCCVL